MPDFHEPVRQDVKQEPPDELVGFKRHDLAFVVISIVSPPEGDLIVFKLHDPMIADCDPVSISAEILQNVLGLLEGLLAVDDPVLLVQIGDQCVKGPRRRKVAYGAGASVFSAIFSAAPDPKGSRPWQGSSCLREDKR